MNKDNTDNLNNQKDYSTVIDLKKLNNSGSIRFKYKLLLKLILALPSFRKIEGWHKNSPVKDNPKEYARSVLDQMGVTIEKASELNIPKQGPCIFVANHPTGLLEVFVWTMTILEVRSDIKMLANNWFDYFTVAQDTIICVDPFTSKESYKANIKGLIEAKKWLENGGALMVFPAGEVAHWNWSSLGVADPPWKQSVLSLSKKTGAPIIPCYSSSRNSLLFNIVGNIHPRLRTLMLAREFSAKQKKTITIATNHNIDTTELDYYLDPEQKMSVLRLASEALNEKPFAEHKANYQEIIEKRDVNLLEQELKQPCIEQLFENNGVFYYVTQGKNIPNIMKEIGRLREYSFRLLGEGSGNSYDIDQYDDDYMQIFIWDSHNKRILGGLRAGRGDTSNKEGLYFLEHVKVKAKFKPVLSQSLDFGRLFVVDDLPKEQNVILLLFRTLPLLLNKYDYKYLVGQVSISSAYPRLAIDIMVRFLEHYYIEKDLYAYVKGKHRYKTSRKHYNFITTLLPYLKSDKQVNKLLYKLFQGRIELPSLFRFYLKCNAELLGFNYDKDFGTVDALMILKRDNIPKYFK